MPGKFLTDIKKAYLSLWIILSSIAFIFMASGFLLSENHMYSLSSMLQSHHNDTCIFCGMTRSFVSILKGNPSQGTILNEAAFPLFSFLIINQLIFIIYLGSKLFKNKIKL